jgi:hypothetical protein
MSETDKMLSNLRWKPDLNRKQQYRKETLHCRKHSTVGNSTGEKHKDKGGASDLRQNTDLNRKQCRKETPPPAPDWDTVVRRALPLIAPPPFLTTSHREILDWRRKDLKEEGFWWVNNIIVFFEKIGYAPTV